VGTNGLGRHIQLNTATDILYVSIPTGSILRIDSASTANGSIAASRSFMLNPFTGGTDAITDIALDTTNDVLYIGLSRSGLGRIGIVIGISGKTTSPLPLDAEIPVSASSPSITIDGPRNRLYVADQFLGGQVLVFDNARTLTGTPPPDRTIQLPFPTPHLFLETTNDRLYASGQSRVVILNNAGTASNTVTAAVAQLSTVNSDLTAVVARP
jgi:hypothetical protein